MAFKNLRTLTAKSTLGFGKYSDMRVGGVLKLSSGHWYLVWVYYNYSMISFDEEVLEELIIKEADRIDKPGTDPEMYDRFIEEHEGKVLGSNPLNKHIHKSMSKSKRYAKYIGFKTRDRVKYSRGNLAWKNQGHRNK